MTTSSDIGRHDKFLSITMDGEEFGIAVLKIKEIIEHGDIVRMPLMPDFFQGAINLRGTGVPVIDLPARLGLGQAKISRRACIVIVETGKQDVGLMVDAVNQVFAIATDEIEPPPTFEGKIHADFIQGMGKVNGRFIVLLDLDALLILEDYDPLRRNASLPGEPVQERDEPARVTVEQA